MLLLSSISPDAPTAFLKELEDIQLNDVGLEATFECEVSKPDMKAEWFKGDKSIKASLDKYQMTSKSGKHTLTISDCQSDDVAKYTVKLNGISSSAKLSVSGMSSNTSSARVILSQFVSCLMQETGSRRDILIDIILQVQTYIKLDTSTNSWEC